jgi:predicted Rossmann-fold nucleotide-binding protein
MRSLSTGRSTVLTTIDAFVVLPGGYGTFDELFETLAWAQLGLRWRR